MTRKQDSMRPDEVGEFYDDRGWLYEIFMGQNLHIGWWDDARPGVDPKDRLTDVLIERTPVSAGQRVLDIGCGTGHPALRLAAATGCDVVGVTVSADQVETAERNAREAGLGKRAEFRLADAAELPFDDDAFDAVWVVETMMYVSDKEGALAEARRVLKPGGTLVLSDYTERTELSDQQREALKEGFTVASLPTAEEYGRLFAKAGFTVARTTDATSHLVRSAERIERVVEEHYPTVVERGGREFAEEFKAMISQVSVLERDHLGYTVVEATT
ncbi:SAM-dependent methyltransferase [Nocardiopsis halotolerans]|uniref:SAM-dependent methyltransferase n=1 Tax=Nocardiopsis halotolerans TaxID=124252 RepID=UPI000374DDB2|nr:class I SAM-dependent methyltransferase [Nocardiopsis halotolerans]